MGPFLPSDPSAAQYAPPQPRARNFSLSGDPHQPIRATPSGDRRVSRDPASRRADAPRKTAPGGGSKGLSVVVQIAVRHGRAREPPKGRWTNAMGIGAGRMFRWAAEDGRLRRAGPGGRGARAGRTSAGREAAPCGPGLPHPGTRGLWPRGTGCRARSRLRSRCRRPVRGSGGGYHDWTPAGWMGCPGRDSGRLRFLM